MDTSNDRRVFTQSEVVKEDGNRIRFFMLVIFFYPCLPLFCLFIFSPLWINGEPKPPKNSESKIQLAISTRVSIKGVTHILELNQRLKRLHSRVIVSEKNMFRLLHEILEGEKRWFSRYIELSIRFEMMPREVRRLKGRLVSKYFIRVIDFEFGEINFNFTYIFPSHPPKTDVHKGKAF